MSSFFLFVFSHFKHLKADFHSVQNVARSTFSERFLLNYKQRSLKIDRATFCTEWKSALRAVCHLNLKTHEKLLLIIIF